MDTVPHRLQSSRTPLDAVPPPPLASSVSDSPASTVPGGADRVAAALLAARAQGRRDDWVAVVGECQALMNALAALQDVALAEVARRESDWCEDGTLGERVHEPGRVTLDAADLAAPALGASHAQAQRRVEQSVRLAAAR